MSSGNGIDFQKNALASHLSGVKRSASVNVELEEGVIKFICHTHAHLRLHAIISENMHLIKHCLMHV